MATKAETFRGDEARRNGKKATSVEPAKPERRTRHASHATVAREENAGDGPPSRKSTRASENHARSDNELTRHASAEKTSSKRRATDEIVKRARVRAGSA